MQKNPPIFIAAHNIRSLYNVGSIFRICACFGVDKLFCTGYTGTPPDKKIEKVALRSVELVNWSKFRSIGKLVKSLKSQYPNLTVIGLENNAKVKKPLRSIQQIHVQGPTLLILGEEIRGISKAVYKYIDQFVYIPQGGKKESLNVSVACGIAVFSLTNKALSTSQRKK